MYLSTHIKSSIDIIKSHTIVLFITAIVTGINILNLLLSYLKHNSWLNIPAMIITFLTTLVMYGLYYEIIEDKYTSMREIFSKYVYGYFIVSLVMALPLMVSSFLLSLTTFENTSQLTLKFISLLVLVMFMYVDPFFFHTNKVIISFKYGIDFFVRNIKESLSLIAAVILLFVFNSILSIKLISLVSVNIFVYALVQYIFLFSFFIIDYALFIVLVLAIKEQHKMV